MTKKEIFAAEQENPGIVFLYPEGKFLKAYEFSAWLLCTRVNPFKTSCRWIGTASAWVVSVGFPIESLDKWSEGLHVDNLADGRKTISFPSASVFPGTSFEKWKDEQIEAARARAAEPSEKNVDNGLRLYGATYRLALELAKDSALLQKNYRYSLGEQLRMTSFRLVTNVDSAGTSSEKLEFISDSIEELRSVQLCLRMLADLGAMPDKRFIYYLEMTSDISNQLHNWEKSLKRGK